MLAVRHSLLLVYLFANAARASSGARHANTGGCELIFVAAEPARMAVALGSNFGILPGGLLLKTCLAVIVATSLCLFFRPTRATTKLICFDHVFEWELSSPSTMLGNLRMQ